MHRFNGYNPTPRPARGLLSLDRPSPNAPPHTPPLADNSTAQVKLCSHLDIFRRSSIWSPSEPHRPSPRKASSRRRRSIGYDWRTMTGRSSHRRRRRLRRRRGHDGTVPTSRGSSPSYRPFRTTTRVLDQLPAHSDTVTVVRRRQQNHRHRHTGCLCLSGVFVYCRFFPLLTLSTRGHRYKLHNTVTI